MICIAHRGNIDGKSPHENSPSLIDSVLELGYDVELDLWKNNEDFYLGHDFAEYLIGPNIEWLLNRSKKLWIHCKNYDSLNAINTLNSDALNYFYHENDKFTITSKGYIWAYPSEIYKQNTICVMPEQYNTKILDDCLGICSDYIKNWCNK